MASFIQSNSPRVTSSSDCGTQRTGKRRSASVCAASRASQAGEGHVPLSYTTVPYHASVKGTCECGTRHLHTLAAGSGSALLLAGRVEIQLRHAAHEGERRSASVCAASWASHVDTGRAASRHQPADWSQCWFEHEGADLQRRRTLAGRGSDTQRAQRAGVARGPAGRRTARTKVVPGASDGAVA
eukprot:1433638-Prymnesium_polylepis.1